MPDLADCLVNFDVESTNEKMIKTLKKPINSLIPLMILSKLPATHGR